jgi:hypothetical protein
LPQLLIGVRLRGESLRIGSLATHDRGGPGGRTEHHHREHSGRHPLQATWSPDGLAGIRSDPAPEPDAGRSYEMGHRLENH